jgi:tRNA(fMet)-specific endonuclease VapC
LRLNDRSTLRRNQKSSSRQRSPIPENDIWIAATAKQHGLTVASRDNHFDYIDGLSTQHW